MAAADADDELKAKPVGTGPFVFADYKPNEYFRATKNPNYWNQPYPYLDEIEFRPIPDALNRRDALLSGSIDLLHSDNGEVITGFRDDDDYVQEEIDNNAEVGYTLLHVTQTLPDGTPSPLQRSAGALRAWPTPRTSRRSTRPSSQGVFPDRQRALRPGHARLPGGHGLPAAAGHGEGQGAHRRVQGREPGPAEPLPGHHPGRDQPDHRPVPEAVVRGGRGRQRHHRPDRPGQLHPHRPPRELPGLPVAQPQRLRPGQPVHLVALQLRCPGR